MSRFRACGLCQKPGPRWRLDRHGDAIVTWSCTGCLALVLDDLLPADQHRHRATITDLVNEPLAEGR